MAIKALNLTTTRKYVSKLDDGNDPTVWHLGTLSSRDVGTIRDSATEISFSGDDEERAAEGIKTSVSRTKMNMEAVRRGLKDVENFLDDNGKPVEFKLVMRDIGGGVKRKVVPNEFLDMIPLPVIEELSDQIMGDNTQAEEEAGN